MPVNVIRRFRMISLLDRILVAKGVWLLVLNMSKDTPLLFRIFTPRPARVTAAQGKHKVHKIHLSFLRATGAKCHMIVVVL